MCIEAPRLHGRCTRWRPGVEPSLRAGPVDRARRPPAVRCSLRAKGTRLDLAPGLVIADRFRLERVLGQGGMGSVWLAQQIALDVPCAVKFIHAEAARSPELRARFEREAKAAAQLRSPYVVQILDHGVWQDAPYIAMELLDGEGLDHRLARRGKLTPREAMGVAQHVGRALAKAHAAGLVHRDLKPANIFLVKDDEREIAKVLDFGIAKTTAMGTDGSTKT